MAFFNGFYLSTYVFLIILYLSRKSLVEIKVSFSTVKEAEATT